MNKCILEIVNSPEKVVLHFSGEFTLYDVTTLQQKIEKTLVVGVKKIEINLAKLFFLDTTAALYINKLLKNIEKKNISSTIICSNKALLETLALVREEIYNIQTTEKQKQNLLKKIGLANYRNYREFLSFMEFIGRLFATKLYYLRSLKNIRFKEIFFEVNESGIKALGIISLTSFLIGLVIAYQSAFQLKLYGANIFIVDMLGISILRELAPLITAIVVAGRSGSAFTAQIGAMKITQELDAMRTMGFDPYIYLVLPRIIALIISMSILIFVADMMGLLGGIVVASIDLGIDKDVFIDRFKEVVAAKHFFLGMLKAPFFAFLIASISIYRGLKVKDDTQSIGKNTTKSVVESIFAVIVCDAIFSILFTNLGI